MQSSCETSYLGAGVTMASDDDDKAPLPEDPTDIFVRSQPAEDQPTEEALAPLPLSYQTSRATQASMTSYDRESGLRTLR